jgi:CheY-like chemotaxis protein
MGECVTKTVLLAEDDEHDAALLKLTLTAAGVSNPVVTVADGDEVLAYFNGEGRFSNRLLFPLPAVLLLDLRMARLGGYEVLAWLQKRPEFRPLIVVVTAIRNIRDVKRAYQLGAHSFITKPSKPEDIHNLRNAYPDHWDFLPPTQGSSGTEILLG